ncbi:MAG: hypothetical protein EXS12_03390 [Phycisphaerales bacterium]|nr:hypothetical protein [Phycisphaerales bacterium]
MGKIVWNMNVILLPAILFAFASQTSPAPTETQKLQEAQVENRKLRDQLATAQKRIKELEAASGMPTTAPVIPSFQTDPIADLMGNPIAVLDFFQKKFAEDMTKARIAMPQEKDSKNTRQIYLAKAKEWLDMNNRLKYSIVWRGRITELDPINGPYQTLEFQCVSTNNLNNFGRASSVTILRSYALQLGTTLPAPEVIWTLNATLEPTLIFDPALLERNTFDNPPLIGPCVAMRYKITGSRLFIEKTSAPEAPIEK